MKLVSNTTLITLNISTSPLVSDKSFIMYTYTWVMHVFWGLRLQYVWWIFSGNFMFLCFFFFCMWGEREMLQWFKKVLVPEKGKCFSESWCYYQRENDWKETRFAERLNHLKHLPPCVNIKHVRYPRVFPWLRSVLTSLILVSVL